MVAVGYAGADINQLDAIGNDPDIDHVFVGSSSADLLEMTNKLTSIVCTSVPFEGQPANYNCDCPYLYTGELCETFVLPCEFSDSNNGNPCWNGGACENINGDSDYSCTCVDGYTGEDCEILIPCSLDPCLNAGNCTNTVDFSDYSWFLLT